MFYKLLLKTLGCKIALHSIACTGPWRTQNNKNEFKETRPCPWKGCHTAIQGKHTACNLTSMTTYCDSLGKMAKCNGLTRNQAAYEMSLVFWRSVRTCATHFPTLVMVRVCITHVLERYTVSTPKSNCVLSIRVMAVEARSMPIRRTFYRS